jgi:sulfoxide reductase heme-binding subunit YedZ
VVKLFEGARIDKKYVLKASALAIIFWLTMFAYHFYVFSPGLFEESMVRGSAYSGAILITIALIIGPLARLTKYSFLYHRRTVGVWGFTFVIMHFLSVLWFYFGFDLSLLQREPAFTILLFGIISFLLYIPMYLTSTDWAVQKLGFRKWKFLHRLIYFAYIFSILHFTLIVKYTEINYARILLFALTAVALAIELAAFVKVSAQHKNKKDILIGILIILFGLAMFYLFLFK